MSERLTIEGEPRQPACASKSTPEEVQKKLVSSVEKAFPYAKVPTPIAGQHNYVISVCIPAVEKCFYAVNIVLYPLAGVHVVTVSLHTESNIHTLAQEFGYSVSSSIPKGYTINSSLEHAAFDISEKLFDCWVAARTEHPMRKELSDALNATLSGFDQIKSEDVSIGCSHDSETNMFTAEVKYSGLCISVYVDDNSNRTQQAKVEFSAISLKDNARVHDAMNNYRLLVRFAETFLSNLNGGLWT